MSLVLKNWIENIQIKIKIPHLKTENLVYTTPNVIEEYDQYSHISLSSLEISAYLHNPSTEKDVLLKMSSVLLRTYKLGKVRQFINTYMCLDHDEIFILVILYAHETATLFGLFILSESTLQDYVGGILQSLVLHNVYYFLVCTIQVYIWPYWCGWLPVASQHPVSMATVWAHCGCDVRGVGWGFHTTLRYQASFWVWAQPMRDDVTIVTSSPFGWVHTQNDSCGPFY